MKNVLEQKEKEYMVKYKKNVDMLKKYTDEKERMQTKVKDYANKVKLLEQKLQHVAPASEELEAYRKGKRDCTEFSSSQKGDLQKPPKQPRVLE